MSFTPKLFLLQLACLFIGSQSVTSRWTYPNNQSSIVINTTLPFGYIHYPNISAAFKIHREESDWHDAKRACISEGGRLAVIDTREKLRYVNATKPRSSAVWVGITKSRSQWVAADSYTYRSGLPWDSNQPHGVGDCVSIKSSGTGLCNNLCFWLKPFVCEILTVPRTYQSPNLINPYSNTGTRVNYTNPYFPYGNQSFGNYNNHHVGSG